MLKPEAWATFLSIAFLVGLKSILIKTETIKLAIPSIRQIRNSKLIENDFNNKIPKKGPMADPRTRLSQNKLVPSLLRSTGVTCAAIVPVAVVAIAVAIPFRSRTNIKMVIDPEIK